MIAKNSARKLREREKANKSQAMSTRDTGDLFYRGSALEGALSIHTPDDVASQPTYGI